MTAPAAHPDGADPGSPVRIAAVGDIHMGEESRGLLRPAFETLGDRADVLLLAGDLTRHGTVEEARVVAEEIAGLPVPVVAVLGNHDHHAGCPEKIAEVLTDGGTAVLEGTSTTVTAGPHRIGVAGTKGFGGGFAGRCASEFGEAEMKSFIGYTRRLADGLGAALAEVAECDVRVALTHFSPVADTLAGEPLEIYPFLGCYQLGQAIDSAPTALALHGHAHHGSERGTTPGGVRVRNVAHPVIKQAYSIFHLGDHLDRS